MTYEGYLSFGGNEIINNARVRGYAQTADCPVYWLKGPNCAGLADMLDDGPYAYSNIAAAPWFDPSNLQSSRFFGVFGLSFKSISDSTRQAAITEGITDGGVIGRSRKATRQVRVRALLLAHGQDALEFGMNWLSAALDDRACGQHGSQCGTTDLEFLSACPPERAGVEDYEAATAGLRRFLHQVGTTSGPLEVSTMTDRNVWARTVEFTVTAERPFIYSSSKNLDLPTVGSAVIDDVPRNLVTRPSAETTDGIVTVTTNYAVNPSLEVNGNFWSTASQVITGTSPGAYLSYGRVNNELAASGTWSYRTRILGDSTTNTAGRSNIYTEYLHGFGGLLPVGTRLSFTVWAAAVVAAGPNLSYFNSVTVRLIWENDTGVTLADTLVGSSTGSFGGRAWSIKSQLPPDGATRVTVRIIHDIGWASSTTPQNNSDIRIYADAVAITNP